jgi:uncharacterized protein
MNPKKQKAKQRRRARKLADEAWEAANGQDLNLALKIIRRAVATQVENPVLWNDQGMLLALAGDDRGAESSFRAALRLAPDYAEPYHHLAALCARQGRVAEAVRFQTQAVRHAPDAPGYADRLEAYRALAGEDRSAKPQAAPPHPRPLSPRGRGEQGDVARWSERLAGRNWEFLANRLTADGCAVLVGLLDADTCASLCGLFDDDSLFVKTVVMDRPDFGQGTYRYFRPPLPGVVDSLRRAVYPYVARVANAWQQLLGSAERFPEDWEDFRERCASAGQTKSTPILIRYGPGGFNALHRDLRGEVFFPIQMAVVLSRPADPDDPADRGFRGGEFLLCDVPEGPKSRRRVVPAGLGDAILFCTRDRLASVGGTYGLQPVMHGVTPITAGTRLVLGVPFHEYR